MRKAYLMVIAGLFAANTAHAQEEAPDTRRPAPTDQYRAQAKASSTILPPRKARPSGSQPAQPADLVPGLPVRDAAGQALGNLDSVRPGGVVIKSELGKIEVDAAAIHKDAKGLFLIIPKARFDALVAEVRTKRTANP